MEHLTEWRDLVLRIHVIIRSLIISIFAFTLKTSIPGRLQPLSSETDFPERNWTILSRTN